MDISLVIPLLNEVESLDELNAWIHRVMKDHSLSYELIMIDDGSSDGSWEKILALKKEFLDQGRKIQTQLWQICCLAGWISNGRGRYRNNDGCRPSGQSGGNSGNAADDS